MICKIGNSYQGTIKIMRLIERRLISSNMDVFFEFEFNEDHDKQVQALTIFKMKKWIETIVDGSLAFNTSSSVPTATIEKIDNHMMFCPEEPYDFLVSLLMHSKLNAIGGDVVDVIRLQVLSDMGDGFGNWVEGDSSGMLPTITEWVGERFYYDKPWWDRSDGGMMDMWPGSDDDVTIKPDILIDLSSDTDDDAEPAEIIKPNFNPTVIKDDQ